MSSIKPPQSTTTPTPGYLALYDALAGLAVVLVAIRCYTLVRYGKRWRWDDSVIVASCLCLLAAVGSVHAEGSYRLLQSVVSLRNRQGDLLSFELINPVYQVAKSTSSLLTNLAVGIMVRKMVDEQHVRYVWFGFVMLLPRPTVQLLIVLAVSCIPIQHVWSHGAGDICPSASSLYALAYMHLAAEVAVEAGAVGFALFLVARGENVSRAWKCSIYVLAGMFGVSRVGSLAIGLQRDVLTSFSFKNIFDSIGVFDMISAVQGMVLASLPAYFVLYQKVTGKEVGNVEIEKAEDGATTDEDRLTFA